jgi:hypothetical protein
MTPRDLSRRFFHGLPQYHEQSDRECSCPDDTGAAMEKGAKALLKPVGRLGGVVPDSTSSPAGTE